MCDKRNAIEPVCECPLPTAASSARCFEWQGYIAVGVCPCTIRKCLPPTYLPDDAAAAAPAAAAPAAAAPLAAAVAAAPLVSLCCYSCPCRLSWRSSPVREVRNVLVSYQDIRHERSVAVRVLAERGILVPLPIP